jgi:hypothetical protein
MPPDDDEETWMYAGSTAMVDQVPVYEDPSAFVTRPV